MLLIGKSINRGCREILTPLRMIQTVKHAGKRVKEMAVTKDDMILEELRYLRSSMDAMRSEVAVLKHVSESMEELKADTAVLKAQHNTGNLSEKVCASVAILALLVSSCVAVTSCKDMNKDEKDNGRRPISIKAFNPSK